MGKKLVIVGADFSLNGIEDSGYTLEYIYEYPINDLETTFNSASTMIFAPTAYQGHSLYTPTADAIEVFLLLSCNIDIVKINGTTNQYSVIKNVNCSQGLNRIYFDDTVKLGTNEYIGVKISTTKSFKYTMDNSSDALQYNVTTSTPMTIHVVLPFLVMKYVQS